MRYIFGSLLGFFLLCISVWEYKKTRDFFSPMCFFSLYQFIKYVPNSLLETAEWNFKLTDKRIAVMVVIEFVFVICVLMGYKSGLSRRQSRNDLIDNRNVVDTSMLQIIVIYCLGLGVKLKTILESGGLGYIMENTSVAYINLTTGGGYSNSLMYLVFLSFFMMMERIKKSRRLKDIILLIIMVVLYAASDLIFSHRSTTLTIIIILLFGYNYLFKKIKIRSFLKPQMLSIILVACIIMIFMPIYRTYGASGGVGDAELSFVNSLDSIVDRLSMVGRDAFVYEHFNMENFWLGKSYLNFFAAPIPSAIWENKPAVDDGFYLIHLINGMDIDPNASVQSMYFNYAIPFTPQGLLYANFGLVGIIIGGLVTGRVYAFFYRKLQKDNNIYNIAMYRVCVIEFGLTTSLLVTSVMQYLYIKGVYCFNRHKYRRKGQMKC